jgi:hypothetical protein
MVFKTVFLDQLLQVRQVAFIAGEGRPDEQVPGLESTSLEERGGLNEHFLAFADKFDSADTADDRFIPQMEAFPKLAGELGLWHRELIEGEAIVNNGHFVTVHTQRG